MAHRRGPVVIYDIPETMSFPATKKNAWSIIDIAGPVLSLAIPGREFYLEINGHDTHVRSEHGVLHMMDVRANMPDNVLLQVDQRMRNYGYAEEDIESLLIFTMLNHVRVIFTGGPRDTAAGFLIAQKKLAFFTQPFIRLAPAMDGAIPKARINYDCVAPVQGSYNETRIWEEGVKRTQARLASMMDECMTPE